MLKLTAAVNYGATISYAGHTANIAPWVRNGNGVGLLAFYNAPVIAAQTVSNPTLAVSAASGSTNLTLAFNTVQGRLYAVESCTDLTAPQWQPLFASFWGTGSPRQVTNSLSSAGRFYRLSILKPD